MKEFADYVIVGGGIATASAASSIRNRDKAGRIVVVSKENHVPYDRTPLSKAYLRGDKREDELYLNKDRYYTRRRIEMIQNHSAEDISLKERCVTLDDERKFEFKRLLIATGGHPRKLAIPGSDLDGFYYLRTVEDSNAIKERIRESRNALVIGGGFIGCEVASTLVSKGLDTTIIEAGKYLLNTAVDEETGRWLANYAEQKGARVLTEAVVSDIYGKDGRVTGVRIADGREIPADLVITGIGIVPDTTLAERAGLEVNNGIMVNGYLETSTAGVFAAGDVARFFSPIYQRYTRVEHYDVAVKQGSIAGANMAGEHLPFDELPYFFSDQFGLEINAFGDLSHRTRVVKKGVLNEKDGFLQYYFDGERISGVLAVNKEWEEIEFARDLVLLRKRYEEIVPKLKRNQILA
ncbi:MAG TPA: FAD-dependent oxidoreductase [Nitrososphaerales archaeon]|nr:FAD-dependent oxidoreductase [Nitrososphaerales archaeon]